MPDHECVFLRTMRRFASKNSQRSAGGRVDRRTDSAIAPDSLQTNHKKAGKSAKLLPAHYFSTFVIRHYKITNFLVTPNPFTFSM